MAKKLESPTSLTEFAPLSPESQSQTFSIRNLFWRSKAKPVKEASTLEKLADKTVIETPTHCPSLVPDCISEVPALPISQNFEATDMEKNRTMSGILRKIMSNVVDKKKKGLQNYKDSDFKQYWMPDSNCKECYECGDRFTTFRRRHHCRVCGQIFCKRCCNQEIPGDFIGYTDDLRVCTYCSKMVQSYVQSLDSSSDVDEEIASFHDSLQQKINFQYRSEPLASPQQNVISPARRKSSVMGFREEDIAKAKPSKSTLSGLTCREHTNTLEIDGNTQDKVHLKVLFDKLVNSVQSVPLWKQDYKSDHCTKVLLGCDIVDWLVKHDSTLTRQDASNVGQSFLDLELFECIVPEQMKFIDGNVFYEPLEISHFEVVQTSQNDSICDIQKSMESLWKKDIQAMNTSVAYDSYEHHMSDGSITPESRSRMSSSNSMFYLDLDLKESRVSVSKPQHCDVEQHKKASVNSVHVTSDAQSGKTSSVDFKPFNEYMQDSFDDSVIKAFKSDNLESSSASIISSKNWQNSQLREDNGEKAAFEKLNSSFKLHEEILLNQLLSSEGLSLTWGEIILPLIHLVVSAVRPDIKNDSDDMDIRQYVQFKKIPGGSKSECAIISGVVFSKTVAHKKMRQKIQEPTVLLLSSSITYQRVENKLSSIEPVIMQEFEYLKNTIGKLTVYKPDILLVEKTVSRLAQEMLLQLGITVVLNVKPSVMERVARGTQAAIVSTIDAHLGRPQLGTCQEFKVKSYQINGGKIKTLIFFDGCPKNLGCTMLLRGGSYAELKKVKQIVQFMTYVEYNWQLERSFLMDEFAKEPSSLTEQMEQVDNENTDNFEAEKETGVQLLKSDKNAVQNSIEHFVENNSKSKPKCDDRKLETKRISDFSDPLHSYLKSETDVFLTDMCDLKVDSPPVTNSFRKLLNDIVLCGSLNVRLSLPYFETDAGKKCPLVKFFPGEIYWSRHFSEEGDSEKLRTMQIGFDGENCSIENFTNSENVEMLPNHNFISYKVTDVLDVSIEFQSLLADFRARGGTLKYLCPHERSSKEKGKKFQSEINKQEQFRNSGTHTNTALCWEKKVDALDPYNHQTLAVLFCSYSCSSNNAPNYCVNPWVVKMNFYGSNDITLGGFLDRYCFRSTYSCPSLDCITPMTEHVRKFVHGSGCVHILLHELSTGVPAAEDTILMWSWCHKCRKATRVVSMSHDTWSFSFAKYLELRFYADSYKRRGTKETCLHSLHHDHYQYFAHKQLVAIFKYTPVLIWEIALPAFVITVNDKAIPVSDIVEQIKTLNMEGHEIYSKFMSMLFSLQKEDTGTSSEDAIDHMTIQLELERPSFREKIEEIQTNLTSPILENMHTNIAEGCQNKEICEYMWKISDQVILLKYHIAEVVQTWNNKIQDFISARKKEEKTFGKSSQVSKNIEPEESDKSSQSCVSEDKAKGLPLTLSSCDSRTILSHFKTVGQEVSPLRRAIEKSMDDKLRKRLFKRYASVERSLSYESILESGTSVVPHFSMRRGGSEPKNFYYESIETNAEGVVLDEDKCSISSSDSSYTYGVTPGIYAGLMVPEPEDNESYVICHKDQMSPCPSPLKGHERSKSEGAEAGASQSFRISLDKQISSEEGIKREKEKKGSRTHKALISLDKFLPTPTIKPLQSPFSQSEHMILPQTEKIPIIVHEDELSSIIAFALASSDYEQQLQELRLNLSNTLNLAQRDCPSTSPMLKRRPQYSKLQSESISSSESPLSNDDISVLCGSQEVDKGSLKSGSRSSNLHLEIQFNDTTTQFSCKVYYAEQFRTLRCLVFSEGEERFIRSLSHCVQWIARGGKSGSTFCKTHDDRFILKQMPKLELQSFLDLAPSYFQYLNKACKDQKPTLLAKIIGIYGIEFKNSTTNRASRVDLLVMENLFYGRSIARKYDLKGSIRNRLINTSGLQEDDIVLLDENLLKVLCDNPLYIRAHAKTVLALAINNDTQFLAEQAVMDYSLLVGLDEEKKELVVGIIDYIRTFTLDKKVESWIKSSGILGGHGKMPTVVSPELYKIRFCEAMDGYFLWIPDRWTGLGKGIDG